MEEWLVALTIAALLVGVWLGSHIDLRGREKERRRAEELQFARDSAQVLGYTGLLLRSLDPFDYVALAPLDDIWSRIESISQEANQIRPQLSELAVRWPEGGAELSKVEKHLGVAPGHLKLVVEAARAEDEAALRRAFDPVSQSHGEALRAFDRTLELLREH